MYHVRSYQHDDDHTGLLRFFERVLPDLGYAFLPDTKDADISDLEKIYLSSNGAFFVLGEEGSISGSVGIRYYSPGIAELKRLYVDKEHRGKGYGRALCSAAIDGARQLRYRALRLDTTRNSPAALKLYESLGFHEIARYNDDPFAELFMEMVL